MDQWVWSQCGTVSVANDVLDGELWVSWSLTCMECMIGTVTGCDGIQKSEGCAFSTNQIKQPFFGLVCTNR